MITYKDINRLIDDERFKNSNTVFKNLKHSVKIMMRGNSNLSVSISFGTNGLSLGLNITKLLYFIGKPFIIAGEIRRFKKDFIKRAFEIYPESLNEKLDFECLIASDYFWIEENKEKIEFLKNVVLQYLTDSKVKEIILDYCPKDMSNEEKDFKYKKVVKLVEETFVYEITKILQSSKKDMDNDYYSYILNTGDFDKIYLKSASSGLLTDNTEE